MYLLLGTRGPFMTERNKTLMDGLWTIEPYLLHRGRGRAAKHETFGFTSGEEVIVFGED